MSDYVFMHAADNNSVMLELRDEAATLCLGGALAKCLVPGMVVYLEGDLGTGKTCLVRGLLSGIGYQGKVKSPTYTLVESHVVSGNIYYHFDFYRLAVPDEFLEAGLEEYFSGDAVCLVEWPELAQPYLPDADVRISLFVAAGGGRSVVCQARSGRGIECLKNLMSLPMGAGISLNTPPQA